MLRGEVDDAETESRVLDACLGDEQVALDAVHRGAQDHLVKGKFESDVLSRCVRYAIERHQLMDLACYREIIEQMPEAEKLASGVLLSVAELQAGGPRGESLQLFYGCRVLHGSLDGIRTLPSTEEIVEDIRIKASSNLHVARHYLLYLHDRREVVHKLAYPFKCCFFALQGWVLVEESRFIERKEDMLTVLSDPLDRQVVKVVRDWHSSERDRTERPLHHIELLERWSSHMLTRLPSRAS